MLAKQLLEEKLIEADKQKNLEQKQNIIKKRQDEERKKEEEEREREKAREDGLKAEEFKNLARKVRFFLNFLGFIIVS